MFIAAALNPDYFKERINLFIALAPCPTTAPIGPPGWIAEHIGLIEYVVVDLLHYYNWVAPMPKAVALVDLICDEASFICQFLESRFNIFWRDINNSKRFDVFLSNEPSGSSYRTFVFEM